MTITLGWWVLPTLVTIACATFVLWPKESSGGGYGAIGDGIVSFILALFAIIVILSAWLLWAIL